MVAFFGCGIFFGVEELNHGRGHVLRGFVTSLEPLCSSHPRSTAPVQCVAAAAGTIL